MLDALHTYVVGHCSLVAERAEGAAFLRAAKDLYNLIGLQYVCINLPAGGRDISHIAFTPMLVCNNFAAAMRSVSNEMAGASPPPRNVP